MTVPMPARNTTEDVVARAADKCLRLACMKHFPMVPIGDVAEVVSGGTPATGKAEFWDGDVVWVTPKDLGKPHNIEVDSAERAITRLGLESSSARLLPEGTVLLSSRAPIGHLGIAKRPLATNQGFKNIICSKRLNNRFLFHILRGSIDELAAEGRGNTFTEIPGKVVKVFNVPLPALAVQEAVAGFLDALYLKLSGQRIELPPLPTPLGEHRQIVGRIDELAAQVHEAHTLRQQAILEAAALIASCVSQLFREGARHGWGQGVLGDYVADDCYGTSEKTSNDNSGTPVLRMGNIQGGRLDLRDLKYLHFSEKAHDRLMLARGDILVNRTNSAELVGKCAVFGAEGDYSFASYLIRLRLDLQRAEPHLVAAYINSPLGRAYMLSEKKQMTGQANVNSTKLKALPIALPPLPEQRRIVAELDALQAEVDALKRLQAETAAELDALLPAILDRAFKGEL